MIVQKNEGSSGTTAQTQGCSALQSPLLSSGHPIRPPTQAALSLSCPRLTRWARGPLLRLRRAIHGHGLGRGAGGERAYGGGDCPCLHRLRRVLTVVQQATVGRYQGTGP